MTNTVNFVLNTIYPQKYFLMIVFQAFDQFCSIVGGTLKNYFSKSALNQGVI